jgi:hypothetical protein
MVMGA